MGTRALTTREVDRMISGESRFGLLPLKIAVKAAKNAATNISHPPGQDIPPAPQSAPVVVASGSPAMVLGVAVLGLGAGVGIGWMMGSMLGSRGHRA